VPSAIVIASLTAAPDAARLGELAATSQVLELRADLFEPPDIDWLREHFPGRLLYTLRSAGEGGQDRSDRSERRARLGAAAGVYDLVDLETRDLDGGIHDQVPVAQRVLSWHGRPDDLEALQAVAARLLEEPAHWYKVVNWVKRSGEDRWPLALLAALGRSDVIAFGAGEIGAWTRLVATVLGSPALFAAGGPQAAAAGQLPVERLATDYQWPLGEVQSLLGVVGRPVGHSLSPHLFNRALRRLGLPMLYLAFHVEKFGEFWLDVVEEGGAEGGLELGGLSVTAPDKLIAIAVAGVTSPLSEAIGSANTLVRRDDVWAANSTDPEGIMGPLRRRDIVVRGRRAAVLGAGGAGRAAGWALRDAGAKVTLFNRSPARSVEVSRDLELDCLSWEAFDPAQFGVVVHATPLGRDDADPLPCAVSLLPQDAVGLDLVYRREGPTPWVAALRDQGRIGIDGREALLFQALPQFEAMTGQEMPPELVAELLSEIDP